MYIEDLLSQIISARSLLIFAFYVSAIVLICLVLGQRFFVSKQDSLISIALSLIFFAGFFSTDIAVGTLTSALVAMTIALMWLGIQPLRRSARKANVIITVSHKKGAIYVANRGTNEAKDLKIISNIKGMEENYSSKVPPESIISIKCKKLPERIELRWTTDTDQVLSYGIWRKPKGFFKTERFYVLEHSS